MSDSKPNKTTVQERRGFLKGALLAGGAATVTQSASAATNVLNETEKTAPAKVETTAKYRETEHVKTYYRLARF